MEQVDVSTLGLGVDASQVVAADQALDRFADSAKKAETEADRFVKTHERQAAILGKSRAQVAEYDGRMRGLSKTQQEQVQASLRAIEAYERQQAAMTRLKNIATALWSAIGITLVAAFATLTAIIFKSIQAAGEAADEQIRLGGILRATGHAAGLAAKEIHQLADAMAASTRFDDESIKKAASEMLVFKNVQGETFKQGLKLAADMAALYGGQVVDHVRNLGRALDDPAEGLMMLERSFGKLDDRMKDQIKTMIEENRLAEAQARVLDYVRGKVGGMAEAMNTGLKAASQNAAKEWGDFLEELGETPAYAEGAAAAIKMVRDVIEDLRKTITGGESKITKFNDLMRSVFGWTPAGAIIGALQDWAAGVDKSREKLEELKKEQQSTLEALNNAKVGGQLLISVQALESKLKRINAEIAVAQAIVDAKEGKYQDQVDRAGGRTPSDAGSAAQREAQAAEASYAAYKKLVEAMKEVTGESQKEAQALDDLTKWWGRLTGVDLENAIKKYGSLEKAKAQLRAEFPRNKKAAEEFKASMENATKIVAESKGVNVEYEKNLRDLELAYNRGKIGIEDYRKAVEHLIRTQTDAGKSAEDVKKKHKELNDEALSKYREETSALTKELQEQAVRMEEEAELVGKTEAAILDLAVAKKELEVATLRAGDGEEWYTKQIESQLDALKRMRDAAYLKQSREQSRKDAEDTKSQWIDIFKTIDDTAQEAFTDILHGGRDVFKRLADALKSTVMAALYQLTVRPFIINVLANVTGQQGVANQMLGSNGGPSGLLGSGTGLLGGFIDGLNVGSGAMMGPAAPGFMSGLGQSAAGLLGPGTSSALASGLSMMQAALPYVGIAVALYSMFAKPGGGPKGGGSFMAAFSGAGKFQESVSVAGSDNGRFFTPSDRDNEARTLGTAAASGFAQYLAALGGSSSGFKMGIGFDTDPKGTANDRVSSQVFDSAGNLIFRSQDRDAGKGNLQSELELETQRMILAALKASELPAEIAAIFDELDPSTASLEEIKEAFQAAGELKAVLDVLKQIDIKGLDVTALKAMQRNGESLTQTTERISNQWAAFDQAFTTDAERMAKAQALVTKTFKDAGVEVPKSKEAFKDLLEGLDLTTEAGRNLWQTLLEVAPAFAMVADAEAERAARLRDSWEETRRLIARASGKDMDAWERSNLASQFQASQSWAQGMSFDQIVSALTSKLTDDSVWATFDEATQSLIQAILSLAGQMEQNTEAIQQNQVFGNTANALREQNRDANLADFENRFGGVINAEPSLLGRMTLRQKLLEDRIWSNARQVGGLLESGVPKNDPRVTGLLSANEVFQAEFDAMPDKIGRLLALIAEFGEATGEQVFELEEWYAEQKRIIGDNQVALLALEEIYQNRRRDLTEAATEEMQKKLKGFLGSLLTGNLSPLSAEQKLAELEKQYRDALGTKDADKIQQAAQAYLQQAREMFASSPAYNAIFTRIWEEINALTGNAVEAPWQSAITSSMPEGKIVSQDDLAKMRNEMQAQNERLVEAVVISCEGVVAAINGSSTPVTNPAGGLVTP